MEIGVSAINGCVGRNQKMKWNVRVGDTVTVTHMTQTQTHTVNVTEDFLVHTVNWIMNLPQITLQKILLQEIPLQEPHSVHVLKSILHAVSTLSLSENGGMTVLPCK